MAMPKQNPGCFLPDEVIEAILVCLPIKYAVRTSILSSDWKFKWHTMPELVFNNECLPPSANEDYPLNKLVYIVDSVLNLHVGPVHRFELSTDLPSCSDINRWIIFLSRNQIKEISLRFINGAPYSVPSYLFSCTTLTYLELHRCVLKLPASFQQFTRLTTLKLSYVDDPRRRIETLISGCPSLRVLSLVYISGTGHLNINSPNLHEVYIHHSQYGISFGYSPYLSKATFCFEDHHMDNEETSRNILGGLPNIQKLQFVGTAIQWFDSDDNTSRYDYLKSLHIEVDFQSEEEVTAALCLLGRCPNLEVLHIQVTFVEDADRLGSSIDTNSWEPVHVDLTFNRLKIVKMAGMIGTVQELYLLARLHMGAPLLETITISVDHDRCLIDDPKTITDAMRDQIAPTQAEIIYTQNLVLP